MKLRVHCKHCVVKLQATLMFKMNHMDFLSSFNFSCLHCIQEYLDLELSRLAQRQQKVRSLYVKTSARNLWCTLALNYSWDPGAKPAPLHLSFSPRHFTNELQNCTFFFSVRSSDDDWIGMKQNLSMSYDQMIFNDRWAFLWRIFSLCELLKIA